MKKLIITLILCAAAFALFAAGINPERQYIEHASQVFAQGNYKYASELYNSALKINPQSADAYIGIGTCSEMLTDMKTAEFNYNKAQALDPTVQLPNLRKVKELEKYDRGKNIDKIRARYHALFGKKKPEDAIIDNSPTAMLAPPAHSANTTPTASDKKPSPFAGDKEWWYKGGAGKMLSLGGISFIYPDRSTAVDAAGFGIDAGLLFRKNMHVFNLAPKYGYTRDLIRFTAPGAPEVKYNSMLVSIADGGGELAWPNEMFFNGITPYYFNSYINDDTNSILKRSNSGNLFGGKYTAGFKMLPVFGVAGSIGYKYAPYTEITQDSTGNTRTEMNAMALFWQVGAGLKLPGLFSNEDGIDFTACWGSYHPEQDAFDPKNSFWLDLPYSLINTYTFKTVSKKPFIDFMSLSLGTIESTESLSASGYVYKGGLHYNLGNEAQEVFAFIEAPYAIEYKTQSTTALKYNDVPVAVSETKSDLITIGKGRKFYMETGFRSNLKYVITGFKYAFDYSENYMSAGSAIISSVVAGKQIDKNHIFTTGLNIVPMQYFTIPFEVNYGLYSSETDFIIQYINNLSIRGGLELKPFPILAFRGGLSYETLSVTYAKMAVPAPSPQSIMGYHVGAGIDMPMFEINIGGAYKERTTTPLPAGVKSRSNYYMLWTADLNIYI